MSNENLNTAALMTPAEIRLLSSLGFMAARSGHVVPAIRIFEGLAVLRQDKAFPYIGLALAMICVGAYGDAVNVLRERGLAARPDDAEIAAYLVVALKLAGRTAEAQAIARGLPSGMAVATGLQALIKSVSGLAEGHRAGQLPQPAPVAVSVSANEE